MLSVLITRLLNGHLLVLLHNPFSDNFSARCVSGIRIVLMLL